MRRGNKAALAKVEGAELQAGTALPGGLGVVILT